MTTPPPVDRWLRFGFLADGCFKLVIAVVYLVLVSALADFLDTGRWLVVVTAIVVALSAVAEIAFALRSAAGTHTKYLIAYDSGWMTVTGVAILLGVNDVGAAGPLWLGFQAIASALLAIVFAAGARAASPG